MNYYEHHIGDYAEATQHLSILEDGVYSRLLRKYYASEKPLPCDVAAVQRLVVARSKEERAAVEVVLQEFFVLADDGWHQPRCDIEIERYNAGEPERQAKKANEEARLKKHREERSSLFERLTAAGQHAPWNITMKDLRARVAALGDGVLGCEPATGETAPATLQVGQPATAPATPATATQTPDSNPQTPDTRHQTPTNKKEMDSPAAGGKRRTRLPQGFQPNEAGRALAVGKGLDVESEVEAFQNYHTSHGSLMADWQAAWRTWVGNAVKFSRNTKGFLPGDSGPAKPGTDRYFKDHRDAQWWKDAGFANVYEAHNGMCWDHNAHLFRDGRKLTAEEAHA